MLCVAAALVSLSACEQKKKADPAKDTTAVKAEADAAKDAPAKEEPKADEDAHDHAPGAHAFDADLMAAALEAKGVSQVRMYFGEGGAQRKTAVYHMDESKVPEAVRELAKETFPDATVVSYELEKYATLGVVHEVEMTTKDGLEVEVASKPDGTLVYSESVQKLGDDVPKAAVKAVVEAEAPGAKVVEVEVKEGPGVYEYRVKATLEGQKAEHVFVFDKQDKMTARYMRFPAKIELQVK